MTTMNNSNNDIELSFEDMTFDTREAEQQPSSPPALDGVEKPTDAKQEDYATEAVCSSPAIASVAPNNTTLVLKNLPFTLKHDKLLEILRQNGIYPQYARYHQHATNGSFRGIAFVKYKNFEETIRAYSILEALDIMDRRVRVEFKKKGSSKSPANATATAAAVTSTSLPTNVPIGNGSSAKTQLASSAPESDAPKPQLVPLTRETNGDVQSAANNSGSPTKEISESAPSVHSKLAEEDVSASVAKRDSPVTKERDEMKKVLLQQLQAFAADESQTQITFPHSLSNSQRKFIHKHANRMGFIHYSQGQSENESTRCICVKKKDKFHHQQQQQQQYGNSPRSGIAEVVGVSAHASDTNATPANVSASTLSATSGVFTPTKQHRSGGAIRGSGGYSPHHQGDNSGRIAGSLDNRSAGGLQSYMREREYLGRSAGDAQPLGYNSPASRQRSVSNTDTVYGNNVKTSPMGAHFGTPPPSGRFYHQQSAAVGDSGGRKRGDSASGSGGRMQSQAAYNSGSSAISIGHNNNNNNQVNSVLSASPPSFMARRQAAMASPSQRKLSVGGIIPPSLLVRQAKGPDGTRGFAAGRGKPLLAL